MRFKLFHPVVALVYYIGLFIFIFAGTHPVSVSIILPGLVCLAYFYAGREKVNSLLTFMLPASLLLGLLNPFFVHRGATTLFYLLDNPVTLEAAAYGAYNSGVLLCVIVLFLSFNRVLDQAAFLYLAARWMPRTALVLDMALHAVSRFSARAAALAAVQRVRGVTLHEGSFKTRLHAATGLLKAFLVRNLEEGMETAAVLKARDYGAARRTAYRVYRFGMRDVIGLAGLVMMILLITVSRIGTSYQFYPRLQPLNVTVFDVFLIGLQAVYVFFPLLLEGYSAVQRGVNHGAY